MDNFDKNSRVNKFEKRRKNTNVITILMVVGVVLLITLFVIWLVGGKKQDNPSESSTSEENNGNETINLENNLTNENDEKKGNEYQTGDNANVDNDEDNANVDNNENENEKESDQNENIEINEIESSDNDNVVSTYTANWQPIGTEQSEPHETPYQKDTVDWKEMEEAIGLAARLDPDDMITWFIGNDGEQKAVGTVSPSDNSETYRVYISWITNEGWKPTQVEILKENEYDN